MAFQSIKKLLPPSCKCMEAPLLEKIRSTLTRPPRSLPNGYYKYCRRVLERLFPKGWDASYPRQCASVAPPLSGCTEASRSNGGSSSLDYDQSLYLKSVLQGGFSPPTHLSEAIVVQSAGKPRPLSKFSGDALLLRPLHGALYDWISTKSWLCRGDPTAQVLSNAGFSEQLGGVLTSGDYASATDNLPIEIAELIIRVASRTSLFVPDSVWEFALRAVRPTLWYTSSDDVHVFEVTTGQMMGSYLSFPLLCIQNYLAFRYAMVQAEVVNHGPLLINGDDILFQSSAEVAETWMRVVGDLGLEVERSKTSVSREFGTLNSTLFRWSKGALVVAPTLRFGMLRRSESPGGLGITFLKFLEGQPPRIRWVMGKEFFKWHVATMRSAGRISCDEFSFRGRLAWRISEMFKLNYDGERVTVPAVPAKHDVQVPPNLYTMMDRGCLSTELEELNGLEMVAWRWTHEFNKRKQAVRWCLEMSCLRAPVAPCVDARGVDVRVRSWLRPTARRRVKARYGVPIPVGRQMVFNHLLQLQDYSVYEALPRYSSVEIQIFNERK